jgi:hypothetical protein
MRRLERVVIIGLAGTRLVRAWRFERIGEPYREKATEWLMREASEDAPPSRKQARREWAEYLLNCPHCFGFWLTLSVAVLWRFRPARLVIEALAGAVIVSAFADHYPNFDLEDAG